MKTQQLDLFQSTDFKEAEQCAIAATVTLADRRVVIDLRQEREGLNRGTDSKSRVFRIWIAAPLKKIYQFARQVSGRNVGDLRGYLIALVNAIEELKLSKNDVETAVVRFKFENDMQYSVLALALRRRHISSIRQYDHGDGNSSYIDVNGSLRDRRYRTLDGELAEVGLAIRGNEDFVSAGDGIPEQMLKYIVHIWDGISEPTGVPICNQVRQHINAPEIAMCPYAIRSLDEIEKASGALARFALTGPLSATSITLRRKVQAVLTESLEVKTDHDRDGSWRFLAILTESLLLAVVPRGLEIKPVGWVHPMKRKTENRISQ